MLDAAMQAQLKTYLGNLREGVELVASLDDSEKSRQTRQLIEQIAGNANPRQIVIPAALI